MYIYMCVCVLLLLFILWMFIINPACLDGLEAYSNTELYSLAFQGLGLGSCTRLHSDTYSEEQTGIRAKVCRSDLSYQLLDMPVVVD